MSVFHGLSDGKIAGIPEAEGGGGVVVVVELVGVDVVGAGVLVAGVELVGAGLLDEPLVALFALVLPAPAPLQP